MVLQRPATHLRLLTTMFERFACWACCQWWQLTHGLQPTYPDSRAYERQLSGVIKYAYSLHTRLHFHLRPPKTLAQHSIHVFHLTPATGCKRPTYFAPVFLLVNLLLMVAREDGSAEAGASSSGAGVWQGPVAGAIAGVLSRFVVFPSDTVKSRMQLQGTQNTKAVYNSTLHAFQRILAQEGVPGFYRGFSAIVFGVIPANMTYFGGYEMGKRFVPESWGFGRDIAVGAVAQVLAGVVFTPLDVIKERMQVRAATLGRADRPR